MMGNKEIDDGELRYLLVGPTSDLVENGPPLPADWVGKPRWNEVLTLGTLPAFKGFEKDFVKHLKYFKTLYDCAEAEKEALPEEWEKKSIAIAKTLFYSRFPA
jgi:dynein heavy chain